MIVNSVFVIAFAFLCFEHFERRSVVGFAQQEKTAYMAICFSLAPPHLLANVWTLNHVTRFRSLRSLNRDFAAQRSPLCAQARRGVSAVQGQWGK